MPPPFLLATRWRAAPLAWHVSVAPPAGGWSSIIGIVVALVGNVLISFALNTQRYAHIKLSKEQEKQNGSSQHDRDSARTKMSGYGTTDGHEDLRVDERDGDKSKGYGQSAGHGEQRPLLDDHARRDSVYSKSTTLSDGRTPEGSSNYLKSPWWWLGIMLMVIGECGNFLAYGFAPASIVSPLGVVALVSNCLIAPWMLHETFRKRDGLGVIIAIAGCVTVVLSASGSNPKLDQDAIWSLISTWEFEAYFGITLALIIALMFASNKYGEKSILIDLSLVGLFGGYTALSTKGVASLLSYTIWRVFTFPVTYLLVTVLVFTAIMQIKYVNRALQRFDSTQVIPTQFVMFTLSVIIGSAILYRDFERKSAEDAAKFVAGCGLTFLGVYCITSGRSGENEDDEEDGESTEEEEAAVDLQQDQPIADRGLSLTVPRPPERTISSRSDGPLIFAQELDNDQTGTAASKATVGPSARAAIHSDPSITPSAKPKLHATTSEPVLPAVAQTSADTSALADANIISPLLRTQSQQPQSRPHTPEMRSPQLEPTTPAAIATTPRFGSIGRHSITDLLPHPGPLTTTLSNSLTAIVADSIRRGVDFRPGGGSIRRKSLRQKRSARFVDGLDWAAAVREEGVNHDPTQQQHSEAESSCLGISSAKHGQAGPPDEPARQG